MKILLILCLLSTGALANYQISIEEADGVQITQTVSPDKKLCKSLGDVFVSVHQKGNNQKNLAKAAKEKGGNFVFVRMESPYYSYKYGGELYSCSDKVSVKHSTFKD